MRVQGILLGLLALAAHVEAVTKTVCASGCDYATVQTAYAAAQADCTIDVLSLKAGEVFVAGRFQFNYRPCGGTLTIQSSRVNELPPLGTRVTPTSQTLALMPTITNSSSFDPVVQFGADEMLITAVDTTNNWVTLQGANSIPTSQLAIGFPISFKDECNGLGPTTNPQPGLPQMLQRFTEYFIVGLRTGSQPQVQISTTPGGPPIAITTADGIDVPSAYYYCQPQASLFLNAANVTLRGLNIVPADPGPQNNGATIMNIGLTESDQRAMVRNIQIQQCLIWRGNPAWFNRGFPTAINMQGIGTVIRDSYVEAAGYGAESHAIVSQVTQNALIENNTLASVGASVFTGGSPGSIPQLLVNGLRVYNNYMPLHGWMYSLTSSDAGGPTPNNPCYFGPDGTGSFFVNLASAPTDCTTGACYTCQSNALWAVDISAQLRPATLAKTRIELKQGQNMEVAGNIVVGNVVRGDVGNTGCIALVLTAQSLIDATGTFFNKNENVWVHDNWCDRVFSGLLMGQVAPDVAGPAAPVTGMTVLDSNTYQVASTWSRYGFAYFTGMVGTGDIPFLNGRNFSTGAVDSAHFYAPINGDDAAWHFTATGTYTSGGTVRTAVWPSSRNVVFDNNLLTRVAGLELDGNPAAGTQSRPFRMYHSHPGGPRGTRTTVRQDANGRTYFGVMFETSAQNGVPLPNSQAIFKNNIMVSYRHPFFDSELTVQDCSTLGYGGLFASPGAFSHALMAGPNSQWPVAGPACADQSTLLTETADSTVGFAGSDQSVIANSKLASMSRYSASASAPLLLNDDGTDLGADIDAITQATSGTLAGVPGWTARAGLRIEPGSVNALVNLQGTAAWTVNLFSRPARIPANQITSVSDACAACVVDGTRRQIVVSGLTPGTTYYYSATDGVRTLVGQFSTVAAGSGVYSFTLTGTGVRYSSNRNMSGAEAASAGIVPVASQAIVYTDHGVGSSVVAVIAR
jgi:hypothetical protein